MSTPPVPLTFVNFGQGGSKYDTETRKRIRAHVMREFAKKRRIEETIAFQNQTNRDPALALQTRQAIKNDKDEKKLEIIMDHRSILTPNTTSIIGSVRADPFESLPVKSSPYIHIMLDHYVRRVSPRMIPRHVTGEESPLNKWWVPLAMTDPALFHSLLLTATHSYSIMSTEETMGLRPFYHRGESIRLINEAMHDEERATADAVIAAVLNTAAYEVTTGNYFAYDAHMSGLVSLIRMKGGLEALGLNGFLEQMVYWTDTLGSSLTSQPPRFAKPVNKHVLEPMVALKHTHSNPYSSINLSPGSGFQALRSTHKIGPHTAKILESACCLTVALEHRTQHIVSHPGFMGYEKQRDLIDLHLLNLRKPPSSTPIQDICALAALIYTRSTLHERASLSANDARILDRLKFALSDIGGFAYLTSSCDTILQCLLWATLLGAMIATGSLKQWYYNSVSEVAGCLGLQQWVDVKGILVRFLWYDALCDKPAIGAWEEATGLEWAMNDV